MIDRIQGDTAGAFEHLLVSMATACRDEDTLDPELAIEQAAELDKAGMSILIKKIHAGLPYQNIYRQ